MSFPFTRRFLAVTLALAAVAAIALNQRAILQLRAENRAAQGQADEAQRLAAVHAGLPDLLAAHEEAEKLRNGNADLPRLRNEVRQLRRQTEELAALRAEHERLSGENHPAASGK